MNIIIRKAIVKTHRISILAYEFSPDFLYEN